MFNGNCIKKVFFALIICLLFSNLTKAFTDGDDITASGFNWGDWSPAYPMYYVDSSNYVRKIIVKSYKVSDHYYDPTHCYTKEGNGISHVHFEYELGNGGLPTKSQVNDYYDARFRFPDITYNYSTSSASTKTNCHAFAFASSFDGIYEYWVEDVGQVLSDDAYIVYPIYSSPLIPIQSSDVIHYGNGDPLKTHSTFYVSDGGSSEALVWKWAYSQIFCIATNSNCYHTPYNVGGVWYNPTNNSQPTHTLSFNISNWTWSETGGGDYCAPDTFVYRRN